MNSQRHLSRISTIVLAASLLLQLFLPGWSGPAPAQASAGDRLTTPDRALQAAGPQAEPSALALLRFALDQTVRQVVTALGWQTVSLQSQLDEPTVEADGLLLDGSGRWRVQALDDKQAALTLDGALHFHLEGQALSSVSHAVVSVRETISGTLGAPDLRLTFDGTISAENSSPVSTQTAALNLHLDRSGEASAAHLTASGQTRSVAYNVSQTTTQGAFERDGRRGTTTQTVTTRVFSPGESEVWVQAAGTAAGSKSAGDPPVETGVEQHYFQSVSVDGLRQYVDRFDLRTAQGRYSLPAPTEVTGTLGGDLTYDLALVDGRGETIHVKSDASGAPRSAAPARLLPASYSPVPGGGPRLNFLDSGPLGPATFGEAFPQAKGSSGTGFTTQQIVVAGALVTIAIVTGGGAVAVVAVAAGSEVGMEVAAGFIYTAAGGALGVGAGAGVNAAINGDPYFVLPDLRPADDSAAAVPVQITRVTGGLIAPVGILTATTTGGAVSAPDAGPYTYNDRPATFVGGAVPTGASPIGAWVWDTARTFGAAPSHTQPQAGGTQRHYFIHASTPLTVTADDNLIQYVYLDPQSPPTEILLQFYAGGDGEHRAFWGENRIQSGGAPGSAALYPMGAMPGQGGWVRLQIPAAKVGLTGKPISGVLYAAYGGQTWWGPTTTSSRLTDNAPAALQVTAPQAMPANLPGAQIAFRLAQPRRLSVDILDASGAPVRALLKDQDRPAGYQVLTWDGKDESGATVPDKLYRVRLSAGGQSLAEADVTISPLVAAIWTPGRFTRIRGIDVPVIGEAYGANFDRYVLSYGAGLQPTDWITASTGASPVMRPADQEALRLFNPGNLASWNVGLDEYAPWTEPGLNGVYTLRLQVFGKDGRTATDSRPVIVGRLAHFPGGGMIVSPDGRATLLVPPLATRDPFALLAIVPAADGDPNGAWRAGLPAGLKGAGEVYEVFPADATFRRPATLELPLPASAGAAPQNPGIWLGDGTPGGWRYLGGTADPKKGTINVPVLGLTGTRALVVVGTAGAAPPSLPSGKPAFDAVALPAPSVVSGNAPFAFYSDLAAGPGEWEALDLAGTQISRVSGAEAGLSGAAAAVKVSRLAGGVRLVRVQATPYDAAQYPLLSFDYRAPGDYAPNLLVRSNGTWWQLRTGNGAPGAQYEGLVRNLNAPPFVADDAWHHYRLDLLAALRDAQPQATAFQVDKIVLGQVVAVAYAQYTAVDDGPVGDAYYVRNFAALRPANVTALKLALRPAAGQTLSGYGLALDRNADTVPSAAAVGAANEITMPVPNGDGLWYLHARGRTASGQWTATAHFPALIDRQPPAVGQPDPPPGGAGPADSILLPLRDADGGVDPTSLRVRLNGFDARFGPGLAYSPDLNAVEIVPNLLPLPKPIAGGDRVELTLLAAADYAGNQLAKPYPWAFTADRPRFAGEPFRQLTSAGGTSPAISPDGSQVAFVSSRLGRDRLWVLRSDDYMEAAQSARELTAATVLTTSAAIESDPAWSPDGGALAFVSDATGSPQIWTASPDGSEAHAITHLEGRLASPTWSPDGKSLAFVRDGNLWWVNADGTGARAVTSYAEQPLRAARWQPGGSLLAVDFKLYQETIELYDLATGELKPLTQGGQDTAPAWLNAGTLLYTAPAPDGRLDAIWQIDLDGSGQALLPGSGQPGAGDMQPAPADGGGSLAIASTRAGGHDIWLQATLQIARLDVLPSTGVIPATDAPLQIAYALPADADVSLEIADPGGAVRRALLDKAHQVKGPQSVSFDGLGADGKPLPAADYTVRLSAQIAGSGEPLVRFATARVLDAANIGTLVLPVEQWAGQQVANPLDLHVRVYAEGQRAHALAQTDSDSQSIFQLPAGRYDLTVEYGPVRSDLTGVTVEAGQVVTQPVDLRLGALEVTLKQASQAADAPLEAMNGLAAVRVSRSDDPTHASLAEQYVGLSTFVLPPGRYDVQAELQGTQQQIRGVDVKTAQVTRRDVILENGLLRLTVLSFDGQPIRADRILAVQAFAPGDHQTVVAEADAGPAELTLPAGRYDVRIQVAASDQVTTTSGVVESWLTGVHVQSGQTVEREYRLPVGQVTLDIWEAAGKPADAQSLDWAIYHEGDLTQPVVTAGQTNHETLLLPAGAYDVFVNVAGTQLVAMGPLASFEVREGQSVSQSLNLKLGRIRIEVRDPGGQLTDATNLSANIYPLGKPEEQFATTSSANPLDLPAQAGVVYEVAIGLDTRQLIVSGRSVKEGATVTIKVNAGDFK